MRRLRHWSARRRPASRWALVVLGAWSLACGDNQREPDAGWPPIPGFAAPPKYHCVAAAPATLAPRWIAGGTGPRGEVGRFGKPDAILIDGAILLAGDEDPAYEELHLYDLDSDQPATSGEWLLGLIDFGADPGPGGEGELEFRGISGLARSPVDNRLVIVEQGNRRLQLLHPTGAPPTDPFYQFDSFAGTAAGDPDNPADGELVRPQAVRFDSLGRLFLTDDARDNHERARRDVQVFSPELEYLFKFGDSSYGPAGEGGNLIEPENLVIDEARNRVYVCDEATREIVVYQYDDRGYIARLGGFTGVPNGVDIDHRGFLYAVDEGGDQEPYVRVFDPRSLVQIYQFGGGGDSSPGKLASPDTLITDVAGDLLVVADQGHDRIQGFYLSEIQQAACISAARLLAPSRAMTGRSITLRFDLLGPDGAIDRARLSGTATISATDASGDRVAVTPATMSLDGGVGVAALLLDQPGAMVIEVAYGGLRASREILVEAAPDERWLTGELAGDELRWRPDDGVIRLAGEVVVADGSRLEIAPGTMVMLEPEARLLVAGELVAVGSFSAPISFFAADPAAPWAQLDHTGNAAYDYVLIADGGATPQIHHCCGPILHARGDLFSFDRSVVTASAGKGLYAAPGSRVDISRSAFAHLGMGVELHGEEGRVRNSQLVDFRGADDNDGIYFSGGGSFEVSNSLVAGGDDDGIDTLGSSPRLSRLVVHGFADKGISIDAGAAEIVDSLIFDCDRGVVVKDDQHAGPMSLLLARTSISDNRSVGFQLWDHDGSGDAEIAATVEEVIIWGSPVDLATDFDPGGIDLRYSVVGNDPGAAATGVIVANPRFIDRRRHDYRLNPLSPAMTAGGSGGRVGWPGY